MPVIDAFFRLAIETSVRAFALAALVAFLLTALRIRSSALRHATWTMVLGAMLLMPALPSVVPSVPITVPLPLPSVELAPVIPDERLLTPHVVADVWPLVGSTGAPHPTATLADGRPATIVNAATAIVAIYAIGVAILGLRLINGWRVSRRMRRTSAAVMDDLARRGRALDRRRLAEGGCSAQSRFYQSAHVTAPVTVGALLPRIILPTTWRSWPDDKLHAVLAHEQAHVRRRDPLVALLAAVNHALFWFHPVAWWLRRTLAVTAEHACDEAAVRAIRDPRRYAEVLIDMADVVRRGGGRRSWQVGVGGTGVLGQRIDRILGGVPPTISRGRKMLVISGCVAAIAVVVACRRDVMVPLREDPAVTERLKKQAENEALRKDGHSMTFEQAQQLQSSWEKNPADRVALRKLLAFYEWPSRQKNVLDVRAFIEARRRVGLWAIEHLPDDAGANVRFSTSADEEGYAAAKRHWLAHTARPDASIDRLFRAAFFFVGVEPRLAEELGIRAVAKEPGDDSSSRLGMLYSSIFVSKARGSVAIDDEHVTEIRNRLATSSDAALLISASRMILSSEVPETRKLGVDFLERAIALDPRNTFAAELLARHRRLDLEREIRAKLATQTASGLSPDDRLVILPILAYDAYMSALAYDTAKDRVTADARWVEARTYAEDARKLAEALPQHPESGNVLYGAHMTLSALAMWPGTDKKRAADHVRAAANAPVADSLAAENPLFAIRRPLAELLRSGERGVVLEYLDRMAPKGGSHSKELRDSAAAIRAGRAPAWYQYQTHG